MLLGAAETVPSLHLRVTSDRTWHDVTHLAPVFPFCCALCLAGRKCWGVTDHEIALSAELSRYLKWFCSAEELQWETYSGTECMSCCTWQVPSNVKSLWLVSVSTRAKLSLTYFSKKKCAFPIFLFNGNFLYLVSHTFFPPPLPTMSLLL